MAEQNKTVIAKLTPAEHVKLRSICKKQKPPVTLKDFVRGLVITAISERAA